MLLLLYLLLAITPPQPAPHTPSPFSRLRRDYDIQSGVPIVLSTERPRMGLVYHTEEGANLLDYQVRAAGLHVVALQQRAARVCTSRMSRVQGVQLQSLVAATCTAV